MTILTIFIYNNFQEKWLYFSPCCWSGMLLMMSESPVKGEMTHLKTVKSSDGVLTANAVNVF